MRRFWIVGALLALALVPAAPASAGDTYTATLKVSAANPSSNASLARARAVVACDRGVGYRIAKITVARGGHRKAFTFPCAALVTTTTRAPVTTAAPPSTAAPTTAAPPPPTTAALVCANGSYVNSVGNRVCSPTAAPSAPAGATAQCNDGTYSFSQSRSGTCSSHGGVRQWL
jgi:hypothetical protein